MPDITSLATIPALAAIIVALVQVTKGYFRTDVIPFVALGSGVILAILVGLAQAHIVDVASLVTYGLFGLLAGLTATGGYEATIDKWKKPASDTK